ncbi:quaternary ammonium compound-resistance protein SugE [Shigella flexneri]|nr:quaternary ammonium compound-resistance protein SugE [Shigella flexneri]
MSWIILVIAGLLEVVWAVGLKYTHGFSRLMPCGRVLAQSARPSPALCCSVSPLTRCVWRVWR